MAKCGICDGPYRKGRIAFVMAGRGLKGMRVCQKCARDGVLLVAARPRQKVVERIAPDKDAVAMVRELLKSAKLVSSSMGAGEFFQGKVEAFEDILHRLEKGR